MKKTPFLLNILGLTVAFAAFTVIIMQVNYDLGYDTQYKEADRLYRIEGVFDAKQPNLFSSYLSRPFGRMLFDGTPEFEAAGVVSDQGNGSIRPTGSNSSYITAHTWMITKDILDVFNVQIIEGDVTQFDQPNTLVVSQSLARQLFPGESAIGKSVSDKSSQPQEATIIGVYKDFPTNASIHNGVLMNIGDRSIDDSSEWSYHHYVRVSPQAQLDSVEARLTRLLWSTDEEADPNDGYRMRLNNLHQIYYSSDLKYDFVEKGNYATTYSLITIAILLIVIAIINFVNFSMAAVPMRIRSINTRKILGCSNASLRLQQLTSATITSLAAYALAVIIVYLLGSSSFATYISANMALIQNIPLLISCLFIAIATGVLAGIYPAIYSTSFPPALVLKGSFSLSPKGRKLRTGLIAIQYVISFVLIMVALFINAQSRFMKKHDLGFRSDYIVLLYVDDYASSQANLDAMESALRQSPDILDITFADGPLVSNGKMGWGRTYKDQQIKFDCLPVAPNFIEFFGMEMLEGRSFVDSDRQKSNGTIIFNKSCVDMYPVLAVGDKYPGHSDEWADIVGIVKDFNFQPLHYRINPIALYVYGTAGWRTQNWMYIRIAPGNVKETFEHIRTILAPFLPQTNMAEKNLTFMDEGIGQLYEKEDRLSFLIMIVSFLSVFISLIGIMGLIYFDTQFRRKEIALRRVLGSTVPGILVMLNLTYLKLSAICFAISLPIAIYIMKTWVRSFQYQAPLYIWIFVVALAGLSLLTATVITLQSYRTVSANPVDSIAKE